MLSISYTSARSHLAKVMVEAQEGPVLITRRGHDEVYVISKSDYERLAKAKAREHIQHKHRGTIDALADR
ncbi:type II toxin-antitoxin system Phd/YefM family antitoxin [Salmonella enterica subsp. enterica]|nr:type II toxin-antitoxin system Phd/YefM family antitoxin [Salmonella enterica subsp. enterica]